ncbi:unnamed protein product, partial [Durusdinium trenchii]
LDLLQYLSGQEALYQLMLSSVLLHRRIWGGSKSMPVGPMDFQEWSELNRGIERQGEDDVPEHVQNKIYCDITAQRVPELSAWPANQVVVPVSDIPEEALPGPGQMAEITGQKVSYSPGESVLQHRASLEGWVFVHSSALLPGSVGSECVTQVEEEIENENPCIWASLCGICLVFSSQPPGIAVPHAVVDCRHLQFLDISDEAKMITLAVKPTAPLDSLTSRRISEELVRAAKLLPDGRWEELCMYKLKMSFESAQVLDLWVRALMQKPCDAMLPDYLHSGSVLRVRADVTDVMTSAFNGEESSRKDLPLFSADETEELHEVSFVGVL